MPTFDVETSHVKTFRPPTRDCPQITQIDPDPSHHRIFDRRSRRWTQISPTRPPTSQPHRHEDTKKARSLHTLNVYRIPRSPDE